MALHFAGGIGDEGLARRWPWIDDDDRPPTRRRRVP